MTTRNLFSLALAFFLYLTATAQTTDIADLEKRAKADPENMELLFQQIEYYVKTDLNREKELAEKAIRIAEQKKDPKALAKSFNYLSWYYLFSNKPDSAISVLNKALAIKEAEKDVLLRAKLYTNLAQASYSLGDFKTQFASLSEAESLLRNRENETEFRDQYKKVLFLKTSAYYGIGLNDEAIKTSIQLKKILDQYPDQAMLGKYYNAVALVYEAMGEYRTAFDYTQKSIGLLKAAQEKQNVAKAYDNLARAYLMLEKYDSCLMYIDTARTYYTAAELPGETGKITETRGDVFFHQKKYNEAIEVYTEALGLYTANEDLDFAAGVESQIGVCRDSLHQYDQAAMHYKKALAFFKESGELSKVSLISYLLAKLEQKRGNISQALDYFFAYSETNDSLISQERVQALTQNEIRYETSLKEATIGRQEAALELQRQRNFLLLTGLALAAVVLLVFAWFIYKLRRQKRFIQKQKEEILHNHRNNIQQLISIFNRQASAEQLKENARENQERLLTLNLLNEMLYKNESSSQGDLKEYLEKLARAKQIASPVKAEIEVDSNPLRLKPNLLKDVGLIVNELITNAYKYAFASQSQPRIRVYAKEGNPGQLHLRVTDNGIGLPAGFNLDIPQASFGLGFVQDLVAQHHGRIKAGNQNGSQFDIELRIG